MADLIQDLKARLSIADVVGKDEKLKPSGRKLVGVDHESLEVSPERGLWTWFSQSPSAGQKALGGDVLSWIAFKRFGRIDVSGDDFTAVLREACNLAGIPYPEQGSTGSPQAIAGAERRAREEILERYLKVAESARTPEFYVRAKQRKSYLTEEVCVRWRLGNAPTLSACLEAGISEKDLRRAALLRDPQRDGPDERPYMFFRDAIVIPCIESGRVVYFTSRYLSDVDGTGKERDKKALHLPTWGSGVGGRGSGNSEQSFPPGLPRPCGFNLEARYHPAAKLVGLLIVEGPLDAIACTEREHPAIAQMGAAPSAELAAKLPSDRIRVYLALDGTKDVTQADRCARAAVLGQFTAVALLTNDQDPDDLDAQGLETIKADARPVLTEYLDHASSLAGAERAKCLETLGRWIAAWADKTPALAGEMRAEAMAALGITEAEYGRWINHGERTDIGAQQVRNFSDDRALESKSDGGNSPGQPAPLKPAPIGLDGRKPFRNFEMLAPDHKDYVETYKRHPLTGEPELVACSRILTIDTIVRDLFKITGDWPCHVLAPGARTPLLFTDRGDILPSISAEDAVDEVAADAGAQKSAPPSIEDTDCEFGRILKNRNGINRIKWIPSTERFKSWIHERTRMEFKERVDARGANFVGVGDLYQSVGALDGEHEYSAVEVRPHWPPMEGHYYAWTQVPAAKPSGGAWLRTLIDFFDNVKDRVSRAVLLSTILTPGWGGPYGKRPAIVATAPDRGCGKTTVAEVTTKIWGGHISINYENRNDEELYQRLLSPAALTKRCALIDNVKGTLTSGTLDQLITADVISGKRMYTGEASRPNTMMYIITANGVRLSRDMATRSYFIELNRPEYRAHWDEDLAEFVYDHMHDIVGDCIDVLRSPVKSQCKQFDRWSKWIKDVLCRACDFLGDVTPDEVVAETIRKRDECDDDLEEARMLVRGVIEKICENAGWVTYSSDQQRMIAFRTHRNPAFIKAAEMVEYFKVIMGKSKLSAKQVNHIVQDHLEAGRMKEIEPKRTAAANGYEVAAEAIDSYLDALDKDYESKSGSLIGGSNATN